MSTTTLTWAARPSVADRQVRWSGASFDAVLVYDATQDCSRRVQGSQVLCGWGHLRRSDKRR